MDEYDEQVERLLPCNPDCFPTNFAGSVVKHSAGCDYGKRPAIAAGLRELGEELDKLRAKCNTKDDEFAQQVAFTDRIIAELKVEVARLTHELLVIGDMAVIDWNDVVVGAVDKAVPVVPKTYRECRRLELEALKHGR